MSRTSDPMTRPVTTSTTRSPQDLLKGAGRELPLSKSRPVNRREFLTLGVTAAALGLQPACRSVRTGRDTGSRVGRLFFTSQGRTGVINADGTGLRYFDFKVPQQVTWQPGPFLSDGRRVIFLSMEARRDGPGRPFDRYYHQTPTHLWLYDLDRDTLTEIATKDREAMGLSSAATMLTSGPASPRRATRPRFGLVALAPKSKSMRIPSKAPPPVDMMEFGFLRSPPATKLSFAMEIFRSWCNQ